MCQFKITYISGGRMRTVLLILPMVTACVCGSPSELMVEVHHQERMRPIAVDFAIKDNTGGIGALPGYSGRGIQRAPTHDILP